MTKKTKQKRLSFAEFAATAKYQKILRKRYRQEKIFKSLGFFAIVFSIVFLFTLIANITMKSRGAFSATVVQMPIFFSHDILKENDAEFLAQANYRKLLLDNIKNHFSEASYSRRNKVKIFHFFSKDSTLDLKEHIIANPEHIGTTQLIWLKTSSNIDQYYKEHTRYIDPFYESLIHKYFNQDAMKISYSWNYFTNGDSTEAELAGVATAIVGSLFTMIIFLAISFPLAVLLALYLEEFSPKNKLTDLIEININNLAAIPSIIFGLLGLAIFINFFEMPRSSALVGGFTLSLMVLPTIVISTRNAIQAIPQNIKDAALGMGASNIQVALHHTLPLALPGILTGTILAVARAIGETAPLLMIGMIAFIVDVPKGFTDPTTVLPVQIYLWSNNPEIGFVEKTSATIMLLLVFLVLFNGLAIYLRNKFSKRW